MYLLFSIRSNGWLTATGQYSSDAKQAKEFPRDTALAFVRKHIDRGNHRLIPVRKEDIL